MRATLHTSEKKLIWAGHAFFVIFLFLTVLLYRERVMVADCAFQFFHLIKTGSFAIYHNRFSPFISQLIPLAAIHAKLPLNAVIILYSVSVPLMSYIFYNLAAHVLKDYRAAVGIALAACMVLTQGFYFAPFELNQAVSLLILLFAFLQIKAGFKIWHWLLLLAGIVLALFFHPLIIIGYLFIMGYGFLKQESYQNKGLYLLLAVFGLAVIMAKSKFLPDPYDSDKMLAFSDPNDPNKISPVKIWNMVKGTFSMSLNGNFVRWLFQDYYLVLIFSALISWHYLRNRNWLLLAYYWLALPAYIILLLVVYPGGNDSIRYYLESHYQLIALIVAVPVAYDLLPRWREKWFLPLLLLAVLFSRLITIYVYKSAFSERLTWYDHLYNYTSQYPETRFLVQEKNLPYLTSRNKLTWASGHETLLYFASQHKKPLKTFLISDNPNQFGYLKNDTDKFMTAFETFKITELPQHYFKLPASQYRELNSVSGEPINPNTISITPKLSKIEVQKSKRIIPVPIQISSEGLLASGLDSGQPVILSYRLYQNGQEVAAHTIKTPLEVDVKGTYDQNLLVETPSKTGVFQIMPVLLPLGLGSWLPENQIELIVK